MTGERQRETDKRRESNNKEVECQNERLADIEIVTERERERERERDRERERQR